MQWQVHFLQASTAIDMRIARWGRQITTARPRRFRRSKSWSTQAFHTCRVFSSNVAKKRSTTSQRATASPIKLFFNLHARAVPYLRSKRAYPFRKPKPPSWLMTWRRTVVIMRVQWAPYRIARRLVKLSSLSMIRFYMPTTLAIKLSTKSSRPAIVISNNRIIRIGSMNRNLTFSKHISDPSSLWQPVKLSSKVKLRL